MGIDPKHLVVWYMFKTDAELDEARANGLKDELERRTRSGLRNACYPEAAISLAMICFATDEDVQRETGGNYWEYFK